MPQRGRVALIKVVVKSPQLSLDVPLTRSRESLFCIGLCILIQSTRADPASVNRLKRDFFSISLFDHPKNSEVIILTYTNLNVTSSKVMASGAKYLNSY